MQYQLYLLELEKTFDNTKVSIYKKFVETFSNGIIVYTFYTDQKVDQGQIKNIFNISNLLLTSSTTPLTKLFLDGKISGRMLLYFQSSTRFSYYFMSQNYEEFESLYNYFQNDKKNQSRLVQYQQSNRTEVVNYEIMYELIA